MKLKYLLAASFYLNTFLVLLVCGYILLIKNSYLGIATLTTEKIISLFVFGLFFVAIFGVITSLLTWSSMRQVKEFICK